MLSMGEETPPELIADSTSATADELLRTLVDHGGECTTRDFTREVGRPNDVVSYHVTHHLIGNGLVKKVGVDETADYPNPPNKYRITDRGRDVVDVLKSWKGNALEGTDAPTGTDVDGEEIEELRAEIEDLKETIDWLTDKVNDHQDTIDFVEQRRGAD